MSSTSQQGLFTLLVTIVASVVFTTTSQSAGGGAIGMVARTVDSTLDGQTARAYTALFNGDRLAASGLTVVKLNNGGQVVLAPNTIAAFTKGADNVTVKLEQGTVTLNRTNAGGILRVEAGEVLVVPATGFRTLGEVAMLDGKITVKATEGTMFLNGPDGPLQATKGKTITLPATRKAARSPQPAGAGGTPAAAGLGSAAKWGGLAAGGAGATLGVASQGGSSRPRGSMGASALGGGHSDSNSDPASGDKEKNPIAVEQVANHVPDQACQHAASHSVPWVACGPGSGR